VQGAYSITRAGSGKKTIYLSGQAVSENPRPQFEWRGLNHKSEQEVRKRRSKKGGGALHIIWVKAKQHEKKCLTLRNEKKGKRKGHTKMIQRPNQKGKKKMFPAPGRMEGRELCGEAAGGTHSTWNIATTRKEGWESSRGATIASKLLTGTKTAVSKSKAQLARPAKRKGNQAL